MLQFYFTLNNPIGLAGGNPTLYGYVGDPNGWIDPLGLAVCKGKERNNQTIDPATGKPIGRFINDGNGNTMIEPAGGSIVSAGKGGVDTHTTYPNGSNYHRYNLFGHANDPTPHGHGHIQGTGSNMKGQGSSIDPFGNKVPWNSNDAHWPLNGLD